MNISSIIIKINTEHWDRVIESLEGLDGVEVPVSDPKSAMAIALISAQDVGEEIAALRAIEEIDGVLAANMHLSYSEEEFAKNLSSLEIAQTINDLKDAKDITYKGDVNSWLYKR
ncbi:hypothetical protein BKH46_08485 [Helicobacter sp. 12S02634-8]|uniref:chaperone NapD n=1 Tax=Helicobacter sp. 12S02634-8 TaxID=1476199 RepID=UPI000BA74113|nr:chaperone NapD [Helicobacter sp. 12S02634-8]PAF46206.1 hypothetical protein BKH46_08485 [Helicobacter sp. 12S02634-8]